jgi:outer membrane protein TolC
LKAVINLPAEMEGAKKVHIVPTASPSVEKREITYEEALGIALDKRPDLGAVRTELKSREFNFGYAKNQLLPNLQFTVGYWSPGISGDQLIYLDDNPLKGVVIGKIPGKKSEALKDAFNLSIKTGQLAWF